MYLIARRLRSAGQERGCVALSRSAFGRNFQPNAHESVALVRAAYGGHSAPRAPSSTGPKRAALAIVALPRRHLNRARTPADRHVAMPRRTASRRVTSSSVAAPRWPITGPAL